MFDIISKQAEVILGLDGVYTAGELESKLSEQSAYERLIRERKDAKMRLYEQYLTGEIDALRYKEQKAIHDAELTGLKRHHSMLVSQAAQKRLKDDEKVRNMAVAQDVANERSLTWTLAETLIDKVEVYPDNRVEVVWKICGFAETAIDGNV